MPQDTSHIYLNNLLYSCGDQKQRGNEQFVHEHSLGYVIAGETHLLTNEGIRIIPAGSIGLARRNQLVKSLKVPPANGIYQAVNIFLTQDFLRRYSIENKIEPVGRYTGDYMRPLPPDPFLVGYFNSLLPYFTENIKPSDTMSELKT